MKYSGHRKLLLNYQSLMSLFSSDTKRTLLHLFLFTNSAQRELVQYVRKVYATAINFPCIITLICAMFIGHKQTNKQTKKKEKER